MSRAKAAVAARTHRRMVPEANWQEWIVRTGAGDLRSGAGEAGPGSGEASLAFSNGHDSSLHEASPHEASLHENIARVAYGHWEARGCPHGSPEVDWLLAEKQVLQRQASGRN